MMYPVWLRTWMILAALVLAGFALAGLQTVRLAGEQADHAETKRLHAVADKKATDAAREKETNLRADLDAIQKRAAEDIENAKVRETDLVESIRNGNRRLSIAVASCAVQPTGNPAATGSSGAGVSRAELDPAAASRIVGITRDGDQAIRERNACVEAYEAVRSRMLQQ